MNTDERLWACFFLFLFSLVVLWGYWIHKDHQLYEFAIKSGYSQVQDIGSSSYHWVKGK